MILSISLNTTSTIQVRDGDNIKQTIHCFFPEILSKVSDLSQMYGEDSFHMIALHGAPILTSRLFPILKESFKDVTFIIDGGKK